MAGFSALGDTGLNSFLEALGRSQLSAPTVLSSQVGPGAFGASRGGSPLCFPSLCLWSLTSRCRFRGLMRLGQAHLDALSFLRSAGPYNSHSVGCRPSSSQSQG